MHDYKPNCFEKAKRGEVFSFNFFPSRNLIRSTTARFHITMDAWRSLKVATRKAPILAHSSKPLLNFAKHVLCVWF